MLNKRMITTLVVGLVLFAGVFAAAVPAQAQSQNEQYMELLRQDLRTGKIEVMTEAMAKLFLIPSLHNMIAGYLIY